MSPFSENVVTILIRSDTVRFSTVPRTVRSDTQLYDIVPGVFNTVQYGTPCNQNCVPATVPFSFVQGFKTSKHNNTHYKHKCLKKNCSRTPIIIPGIIELTKNDDPHLD